MRAPGSEVAALVVLAVVEGDSEERTGATAFRGVWFK